MFNDVFFTAFLQSIFDWLVAFFSALFSGGAS